MIAAADELEKLDRIDDEKLGASFPVRWENFARNASRGLQEYDVIKETRTRVMAA